MGGWQMNGPDGFYLLETRRGVLLRFQCSRCSLEVTFGEGQKSGTVTHCGGKIAKFKGGLFSFLPRRRLTAPNRLLVLP